MSKNILIFSDGTGQAGGVRPDQNLSNVYKLYTATRVSTENDIDPAEQVAFYDPGLGTHTDAGGLRIRLIDSVMQVLGGVTGSGITDNVTDCYEAILKLYRKDDRIYLFGFSRGAYTVRSVAGVLNLCGVPTRDKDGTALPTSGKALRRIADEAVKQVYEHGAGRDRAEFEDEREELARRFRVAHGSEEAGSAPGTSQRGNVAPEFIGVFDTVAALGAVGRRRGLLVGVIAAGIVIGSLLLARVIALVLGFGFLLFFLAISITTCSWIAAKLRRARRKVFVGSSAGTRPHVHYASWKQRNYDRLLDRRTGFARQALSIDETRKDFTQVGWGYAADVAAHDQDPIRWLKQVWFAGNHSDVGGSYPENESRLSDITLQWMIEEATATPHPIQVNPTSLHLFPRPDGQQHSEVVTTRDTLGKWLSQFGWDEEPRKIKPEAILHPSVIERFALAEVEHCGTKAPYRPESLRDHEAVHGYYEAV